MYNEGLTVRAPSDFAGVVVRHVCPMHFVLGFFKVLGRPDEDSAILGGRGQVLAFK